MPFILLTLLAFIVFLVLRRRDLKFLRNRYFVVLALLSLAWWTFLVIDQLRLKSLGCSPDDEMCTSGNTISGDLIWGTMLAIFSLTLVWIPAVFIGLYIQDRKKLTSKK